MSEENGYTPFGNFGCIRNTRKLYSETSTSDSQQITRHLPACAAQRSAQTVGKMYLG